TSAVGAIARARPESSVVLIGSTVGADLSPLEGVANVHLLGEQPYAALPGYLHAFDVCLIPFKQTPLTNATNPVKLFEYLTAGKPIVATDLAEIRQYSRYVRLVSSAEDWLPAVERALSDSDPDEVTTRI